MASMSSTATLDDSLAWLDSILEVGDTFSNDFLTVISTSDHHLSPHGPSFGYPSPLSEDQRSPSNPTLAAPSPSTPSNSQSPSLQLPVVDSSSNVSSSTPASVPKPLRRRIRPKIALDANQPLTARGKPRARVYVACDQW